MFKLPEFCVVCGDGLKANLIQMPTICKECKGEEKEKDNYDQYCESVGLCEVCQSYHCFCD